MTALILFVFLGAAVIAIPIAHALLVAAMAAAATSDKVPLDLLVQQMVAQASAKTGENITVSRFIRFRVGENTE